MARPEPSKTALAVVAAAKVYVDGLTEWKGFTVHECGTLGGLEAAIKAHDSAVAREASARFHRGSGGNELLVGQDAWHKDDWYVFADSLEGFEEAVEDDCCRTCGTPSLIATVSGGPPGFHYRRCEGCDVMWSRPAQESP